MQQAEAGAVTEQKAGVEIISRRELQQCQPWQRAFASQHKDSRYYLNANRSQALRAEFSVHKIRILSGMWNRPRSIRTRVSSTKNGILRSPERRQRAELTQSAAPTEAYRRPRPCRGPAKLRKSLALSDGSDKCATETELVGWGGSNHKEGQNVFFCRALVEYEL